MGACSSNGSADKLIAEAKQELRSMSNLNLHKAGTLLDMDDINKKTQVQAVNVAETLTHLGHVSLSQRKFNDARNYYDRALKIFESSLDDSHISCAETRSSLGVCLLQYAKFEDGLRFWVGPNPDAEKKYIEASQLLESSIPVFKETHGDSIATAKVYASYANTLSATDKFEEADDFFTQATAIIDKSLTFNTQVSPRGIDCKYDALDAIRKDFALAGGSGLEITVFDMKKGGPADQAGVRVGMELFEVSEETGKRKINISNDIEDLVESLRVPVTLHFRELLYVDACRVLTDWGVSLKKQEKFERARTTFQNALRICRFAHGDTSVEYSGVEKEYGHSLHKEGRFEEAYQAYNRSFRFHEKAAEKALKDLKKKSAIVGKMNTDDSLAAPSFLMLGMTQVLLARARGEEAKYYATKAMKLATKCYGREHAAVAFAKNMNALALYLLEKYEEAAEGFREAHVIYSIAIDDHHPAAIHCLVNQACCLARDNPDIGIDAYTEGAGEEYEQALEIFDKALLYYEEAQVTNHPCIAIVYSNMASIYYRLGKFDKAIELHAKAGGMRDAILPGGHVLCGLSQLNSSRAFMQTKEYAEAEKLAELAGTIFKQELGGDHECVSSSEKIIGDAILELQRPDDAFGKFSEVQRIRNYAVDVPARRLTLFESARLYKLGDVADDNDIDIGEKINDNETVCSEDRTNMTEVEKTPSEDTTAPAPNGDAPFGLNEIKEGDAPQDEENEVLPDIVDEEAPADANAMEGDAEQVAGKKHRNSTTSKSKSGKKPAKQTKTASKEVAAVAADESTKTSPIGSTELQKIKQVSAAADSAAIGDEFTETEDKEPIDLDEISYCSSAHSYAETDPRRQGKARRVTLGIANIDAEECMGVCAEWTDMKSAREVFVNVNIEVIPENHVGKPGVSPPIPDSRKPFCILLQQGGCSFVEKATCAAEIGAVGFIAFRNSKGKPFIMSHTSVDAAEPTVHGIMVAQEVGEMMYGACMSQKTPCIKSLVKRKANT